MDQSTDIRKHDRIQRAIVSACEDMGIEARQEFKGKGWRADVYCPNDGRPIAFEIQTTPQTLRKTLERQAKYTNDNILGCWFFENPVSKLNGERTDLPLFYMEDHDDGSLLVNLGDRRKIDLPTFLRNFISGNIQFRTIAKTNLIQRTTLVFYTMDCWKCHETNYLFYVESPLLAACHAKIYTREALWESNSLEYRPEIIALAQQFVESRLDLDLKLAQIKERYSHMVKDSYMSFGCYKCDSLFGDWYVMDAKMDVIYDPAKLSHRGEIKLKETFKFEIPHWCFPDDGQFCDQH
jgi:hypothetical protein